LTTYKLQFPFPLGSLLNVAMVAAGPEPSGWARGHADSGVHTPGKPSITSFSMPPQAVAGKLAGIGVLPSQGTLGDKSLIVMLVGAGEPPSPTVSPARKTSFVPFGAKRSSWAPARSVLGEVTPFRVRVTLVTAPLSPVMLIVDG